MYIKDTIKYKERQDLNKLDETIEHIWIECQGKNNKNYFVGVCHQPRPEDKEKLIWIQTLDTILSARTTTSNKTIAIGGDINIDYNKPSAVPETYTEVLDKCNLKQHVKNPTRRGVKTVDHIVSSLETEKVLTTDALPCRTVSNHEASYAIIQIPRASFQARYKYTRNMKNFNTKEYYTHFSTLADRHVPLKRTKFTRTPAPWMNQVDIIELRKQSAKYRFLAHNIPSKENWINLRNVRNKLKKKQKTQKQHFTIKF